MGMRGNSVGKFALVAIILLMVMILASCSGQATSSSATSQSATSESTTSASATSASNSTETAAVTEPEITVPRYSDNYRNYYEIFVRSFYDSSGDGIGDLKGVTAKLDYISKDVGADGIWFMPIMPSPSYHKYDVTDYYAIDPQYGTLQDFDELMAETEKRDIKVIIDLVVNHTSDMNPWFRKAVEGLWADTENEYAGYYNFTTEYKGSGFSKITDKYYYECRFVSNMPDLNMDNEKVREEILKICKFWIDRGVDGFRLDAVTSFYTGNETKNTEFLKWLSESVKEYKADAYLIGEAWTTQSAITEYYKSGIDSLFNFPFSQIEGKIVRNLNNQTGENLSEAIDSWNDTIKSANPSAIDAPFLSNHDNARSAGFLLRNLNKQKMAASLYLLMPGNPFIYYGEEIGMTGSGNDPDKRLPMLWSTTDSTGITTAPPGANQTISGIAGVDEQLADKNSLLNFYKSVLTIKSRFPEIARGEITQLDTEYEEICAYSMTYKGNTITIFHNLSDKELEVDLASFELHSATIRKYLLCGTAGSSPVINQTKLTLPPYSTTILN